MQRLYKGYRRANYFILNVLVAALMKKFIAMHENVVIYSQGWYKLFFWRSSHN